MGASGVVPSQNPLAVDGWTCGGEPSGGMTTLETYIYDAGTHPVEVFRASEGLWTYDAVNRFSEVGGRTLSTGLTWEDHVWEPVKGTMSSWTTTWQVGGTQRSLSRTYTYDGMDRLVGATHTRSPPGGVVASATYVYDADDRLLVESHPVGAKTGALFRWNGWQRDTRRSLSTQVIESVLPWLRLVGGQPKVVLAELDGHAAWVTNGVTGVVENREVVGAYGLTLPGTKLGPAWALDGQHGSEPDRELSVVHHGARHALFRDGVWMQPEPLLWRGAAQGIERPGWLTGVYAGGDTNRLQDRSGENPVAVVVVETAVTVLSIAAGAVSAAGNTLAGNTEAAVADWAGVGVDTASLWVPGAPGVAGGIRAAKNGGEVIAKFGGEALAGAKSAASALGEAGSKLVDDVADASKSGTATVFKHDLPSGPNISVETTGAGGSFHTEQLRLSGAGPRGGATTIGVVDDTSGVSGSVRIAVPDIEAAQAYQRGVVGTPTGPYNASTNSCLSHACDVLRAGGVDAPTTGSAQKAWLESQGGN